MAKVKGEDVKKKTQVTVKDLAGIVPSIKGPTSPKKEQEEFWKNKKVDDPKLKAAFEGLTVKLDETEKRASDRAAEIERLEKVNEELVKEITALKAAGPSGQRPDK